MVVNLRPDTDTKFVRFDRARVLRVLARIVADLDELAGKSLAAVEDQAEADEAARARHRRRLAEPEYPPKPLTQREQHAVLRKAFGPPPSCHEVQSTGDSTGKLRTQKSSGNW